MVDATWTIRDCDPHEAAALAAELGTQPDDRARARPPRVRRPGGGGRVPGRRVPGHDPFALGDMRRRRAASGPRLPPGRRSASTATTTSTASARPRLWSRAARARRGGRLAPAEPLRGGLRPRRRDARAARGRGLRARAHGRLRDHRRRRDRGRERRRARRDRHRPPPARRGAARLPDRRTRPSAYPFPELCGTGVVYKLAEALLGPGDERLARHLDLVALATIADVVPLVDENRALAIAGMRRLATRRGPACAR